MQHAGHVARRAQWAAGGAWKGYGRLVWLESRRLWAEGIHRLLAAGLRDLCHLSGKAGPTLTLPTGGVASDAKLDAFKATALVRLANMVTEVCVFACAFCTCYCACALVHVPSCCFAWGA